MSANGLVADIGDDTKNFKWGFYAHYGIIELALPLSLAVV
jgi:hypothetical protein